MDAGTRDWKMGGEDQTNKIVARMKLSVGLARGGAWARPKTSHCSDTIGDGDEQAKVDEIGPYADMPAGVELRS